LGVNDASTGGSSLFANVLRKIRKFLGFSDPFLRKLCGEKNIDLDYSGAGVENCLEKSFPKWFQQRGKNVSIDTDGRQFRPVLIHSAAFSFGGFFWE
jgi:hypothetical protein